MSTNPLEQALERTVSTMRQVVDAVPEPDSPFNQRKLSRSDQMAKYVEARDDVEAWAKLIERQGIKLVVEYAQKMESMIDKEIDRA